MSATGLFLALEADGFGAHPAAWRAAAGGPDGVVRPLHLRRTVTAAEAAGFDLVTFADSPLSPSGAPDVQGRLEAGVRAAFVSTLTNRIGLAPTLPVTTTEPFHLATQLASLDHASRGRAAWVVSAPNDPAATATVGADVLDTGALRQEIVDVITAARLLWDSWQDDAVIKDVATGRYLDPDRVHHIDFRGSRFTVKGPLITPRSPQGQVVVIGADTLDVTDHLDVVVVGGADTDEVSARAASARGRGASLVFADLEVALDSPDGTARSRIARLDAATPWTPARSPRAVGSANDLVRDVADLAPHVDGVRLRPAVLDSDLAALAQDGIPALVAAGLVDRPRPGRSPQTLRRRLGLPRPPSRFAGPSDHHATTQLSGAHR